MKDYKMVIVVVCLAIFLVGLSQCGDGDSSNNNDNNSVNYDHDKRPIKSCDLDEMQVIGISTLDWQVESDICNTMVSSLGRNPPVYLLRELFYVSSLVKMKDSNVAPNDTAYQAMNIVEARGQDNNNKAIYNTLNAIWKVYEGTLYHVSFKDIDIYLRNYDGDPTSLSDDDLYAIGAEIWEEKKAQGK